MPEVLRPIDLRSDTVTRPSAEMRRVMAEAPVGDDVYREDPTVNRLQEKVAALLGKEAALFVPSGTMGNQLCLHTLTRPGDEVIIHHDAHVLNYEAGSAAALSGIQLRTVSGILGMIDVPTMLGAIRAKGEHFATTRAVEMENTHNRCGGTIWPLEQMQALSTAARERGLLIHLDGARLWNASVASGVPLADYAATADSVSVCFSKGLGAPIGSAVVGSTDFVEEARVHRKRYGGAMRQVGILAAGAIYALDNNLERLVEDHENAAVIARFLHDVQGVDIAHPVQTNIVIADLRLLGLTAEQVVAALQARGVLCGVAAPAKVRFVTHLDVTRRQVEVAGEITSHVLSDLAGKASTAGQ
jgi:threonine aldolase